MAAETLTAKQAASTVVPFGHGLAGTVKAAIGKYTIAANLEDGDIFELCKLPANCLVIGGMYHLGDIDTGTETVDMDMGWAANGGGAATFTDSGGTTWTNAGENADPDGFVNSGVLTGDAITDLLAGGNLRPFPMASGPLYFSRETIVQAEANAAAATFAEGTLYVVVYYIVL
jgi:hypothetical protein